VDDRESREKRFKDKNGIVQKPKKDDKKKKKLPEKQ